MQVPCPSSACCDTRKSLQNPSRHNAKLLLLTSSYVLHNLGTAVPLRIILAGRFHRTKTIRPLLQALSETHSKTQRFSKVNESIYTAMIILCHRILERTQLSSTHQRLRISRILFERNCEAIGDVQAEVGHLDSMSFQPCLYSDFSSPMPHPTGCQPPAWWFLWLPGFSLAMSSTSTN